MKYFISSLGFCSKNVTSILNKNILLLKKKEVGQHRLIHNLSYPTDTSINDHIPDEIKTVHYSSIDDAIDIILNVGPNVTMAKTDISNAFRIIPIHPHDHAVLGIKFNGCFYFDQCLPMGCASSCSIFEEFSCALQWIAHTKGGITHIVHVLVDFSSIKEEKPFMPKLL